jgi:hypothetical protein
MRPGAAQFGDAPSGGVAGAPPLFKRSHAAMSSGAITAPRLEPGWIGALDAGARVAAITAMARTEDTRRRR